MKSRLTGLTAEQTIWWEELAEKYRKWAYEPPRADGFEDYTCVALQNGDWGLNYLVTVHLAGVWRHRYGHICTPAGSVFSDDRAERRFEFCHWMADTIEEYLETGKGPWETE